MEKSHYESFEYPAATESDSDSNQFFIVQDNGTFLLDRQVQYVTQVQNIKNTLDTTQPNSVYNITPQQFLVDVDNTSELISVSDQYVTDTQSNIFSNSYLLQPGTAALAEPMETQSVEESLVADSVPETNKQSGTCTEITLSDEQYQMLEQKGWLLLEIGDKMYVLNTLGLHDITTNNKLIKKLKNESQSNVNQDTNINNTKDVPEVLSEESYESVKVIIENNIGAVANSSAPMDSEENAAYSAESAKTFTETAMTTNDGAEVQDQDFETNTRVLIIENENIRREGNTLKVKTKLSLKDFPEKIVLGKTSNGKKLVAKVVKLNKNTNEEIRNNDKMEVNPVMISLSPPYNNADSQTVESEFYMLLQYLFGNNMNKVKCTADDVVTADSIISQLLQLPAFKQSVIENNLIITKVIQKTDQFGKAYKRMLSTVVTGKVSQIGEEWRFVHLPHMIANMVNSTEEYVSKCKEGGGIFNHIAKDTLLHIQITEAKETHSGSAGVSITVNKRNIPIKLIINRHQYQSRKMYACSACAAVYGTELELKDHQADHSIEAEDVLTIDIDQSSKSDYSVTETKIGKTYTCMQCNSTFNRLAACKNHLKTHYGASNQEKMELQDENNTKALYKCNMCTCTYQHPSSLSKHIMSRHIKKVALLPSNFIPA